MIQNVTDTQAVITIMHAERMQSHWRAVQIRNLAKFAEYRPPGRRGVKLADGAPEEIAAALSLSIPVATELIVQAEYLVRRLPATIDALQRGDIDAPRVRATVQVTKPLSDEDARKVEAAVLKNGRHASSKEYRRALRRQAMKADPDGAERRRQENKAKRDVVSLKGHDGSAKLVATLSAHEAATTYSVLDHLAHQMKTPEDTRTLAQRRADALLDLVLGKEAERPQAGVNVTVPLTTLIGLNNQPGELSEYGPITAEYCRELARNSSLRRIITDDFGNLLDVGRDRNGPASLADHIRMRDRTCRQPGCAVPGRRCSASHTVPPEAGGPPCSCNYELLCKRHRLMRKRAKGWTHSQPLPGILTFVTPTGLIHQVNYEAYEEPAA
jgi:hypothetical protein